MLFILWFTGVFSLLTNGIRYIAGNVDEYSTHAKPVNGEYTVKIDLRELESNIGRTLYDDGKNKIYVSLVFAHNEVEYQIYFRSVGTYSLNGATLVSAIEHAYSDRGFTNIFHAKAKATYRGETFELFPSGSTGLNYRKGNEFGYYLFPHDKTVSLEEATIIEVTLSNLYLNVWSKR